MTAKMKYIAPSLQLVESFYMYFDISLLKVIITLYMHTTQLNCFLVAWDFLNQFFHDKSFRNSIRMAYSLNPDQVRQYVGPDLGSNCLQRLSADYKSCH